MVHGHFSCEVLPKSSHASEHGSKSEEKRGSWAINRMSTPVRVSQREHRGEGPRDHSLWGGRCGSGGGLLQNVTISQLSQS